MKLKIQLRTQEFQISYLINYLTDLLDIENSHGTKFIIFEPIDQIVDLTNSDEDGLVDKTICNFQFIWIYK